MSSITNYFVQDTIYEEQTQPATQTATQTGDSTSSSSQNQNDQEKTDIDIFNDDASKNFPFKDGSDLILKDDEELMKPLFELENMHCSQEKCLLMNKSILL